MLYYQNRDIAKAVKNIVDTFLTTEIQLAERIKDTFFFHSERYLSISICKSVTKKTHFVHQHLQYIHLHIEIPVSIY